MPEVGVPIIQRHAIWIAILRMVNGEVVAIGMMTLRELTTDCLEMELRMRYNPDIRLVTMRLPPGTRREQVSEAFDLLTDDERRRLYQLPQHPIKARP